MQSAEGEPSTGAMHSQSTSEAVAGYPLVAGARAIAPYATGPAALLPAPAGASAYGVATLPGDFGSIPLEAAYFPPAQDAAVYDQAFAVPTQRPLVEWGRPFYGSGIVPPVQDWFGATNPTLTHFYAYGDYRTGITTGNDGVGEINRWAHRLNLDLDLQLTATERLHALVNPLNRGANFTNVDFSTSPPRFNPFFNGNLVTGFFEGDLGAMFGGAYGTPSSFDLPVTIGLIPLVMQNGVWFEDAVTGAAFTLPARHSDWLGWSNYDATFFAAVDQIDAPAFANNNSQTKMLGTAWFVDAYDGYIEAGWAFLHDGDEVGRSYHNLTISFTRRYFDQVSNAVRLIINTGQQLPRAARTADGGVLLFENSLITRRPNTLVPYANMFLGWGRPQSVARSAFSGGILRNTGINFETDGLTGYPTLDSTAANTVGGAIGVNLLGCSFSDQLVLELAYVRPYSNDPAPFARGEQYGIGGRYQRPLSHSTLIRFDMMYGACESSGDVFGSRAEWRWKF